MHSIVRSEQPRRLKPLPDSGESRGFSSVHRLARALGELFVTGVGWVNRAGSVRSIELKEHQRHSGRSNEYRLPEKPSAAVRDICGQIRGARRGGAWVPSAYARRAHSTRLRPHRIGEVESKPAPDEGNGLIAPHVLAPGCAHCRMQDSIGLFGRSPSFMLKGATTSF